MLNFSGMPSWMFLHKVLHAGTPTCSNTSDCFLFMYLLKEYAQLQFLIIKQPPQKKKHITVSIMMHHELLADVIARIQSIIFPEKNPLLETDMKIIIPSRNKMHKCHQLGPLLCFPFNILGQNPPQKKGPNGINPGNKSTKESLP